MDTAATIPSGALAERWKFSAFAVFSVFVGAVIYPIYANWTWGGGWLAMLGKNLGLGHGHVDFAGSSVVHMTGGVMAFVTAALLGPRRGKYNPDGSVNAIPGHNIPMALIGTFILAFGWFGFNAGSTLAGSDLRIGVIATNTMLAGAAGGITSMLYMWFKYGKPDPSMMANGTLAGLVAITAPCAFVTAPSAVLIGGIAGVLVCVAVFFIDGKLRIDDPVGAISVHGVNGLWGILALGLLADGTYGDGWNGVNGAVRGLFYGDASQFIAQAIGGVANVVGVGAMAFGAYKVTAFLVGGHRVAPEVEELGLDLPEMGALAYPDSPEVASAVILSETASRGVGHVLGEEQRGHRDRRAVVRSAAEPLHAQRSRGRARQALRPDEVQRGVPHGAPGGTGCDGDPVGRLQPRVASGPPPSVRHVERPDRQRKGPAVQGGADSHAPGPGSHRDRCQPQPFGGEPVHLRGELHRHRAERGDEVQQLRGSAAPCDQRMGPGLGQQQPQVVHGARRTVSRRAHLARRSRILGCGRTREQQRQPVRLRGTAVAQAG